MEYTKFELRAERRHNYEPEAQLKWLKWRVSIKVHKDASRTVALVDNEDNARLIVQAPKMYEALRRIVIEGKREDGKYDRFDASGFVKVAEDAIAPIESK